MAELLAIIVFGGVLLAPQIIAGMLARNIGRNFWFWFFISFLIPIISIIILLNLEDKNENKSYKLAEHVKKPNQAEQKLAIKD